MFLLALSACGLEQHFRPVPVAVDDTGGPTSPWDDLDVGSMPDLAFVALWDDVTDIVAYQDPNDGYPCRPGGTLWHAVHHAPNLSVIDVRGQVLGEIALPEPLDLYDYPALQTISPTEALLAGRVNFNERRAWDIDAAALVSHELVAWDLGDQGLTSITVRGRPHPIDPGFADIHPTRIGDTLYVAGELVYSLTATPLDHAALYAYDLTDPDAAPRVWTFADLLPPEFADVSLAPQALITHLHPSNGELVLQVAFFGPAWDGSNPASEWRYIRLVFLPNTGARSWTIDVSGPELDTWTEPMHRHTDAGRAALFTQLAYTNPDPALVLYDAARSPRMIHPPDRTCLAGLGILDADPPTVFYSHHDPNGPDDYGTAIVVNHAGHDVWRIDAMRLGLGERRANVRALVALE